MNTRRTLLAGVTGAVGVPMASATAGQATNPDTDLIRVCRQFAEATLEDWYRYVAAYPNEPDDGPPPDWDA